MCTKALLILHLLFLILQSGKFSNSQEQREGKHTENNPKRTTLNILPSKFLRIIIEELVIRMSHNNVQYVSDRMCSDKQERKT